MQLQRKNLNVLSSNIVNMLAFACRAVNSKYLATEWVLAFSTSKVNNTNSSYLIRKV